MRFLKNKIVQTVSAIMFIAIIGVVVYTSIDTKVKADDTVTMQYVNDKIGELQAQIDTLNNTITEQNVKIGNLESENKTLKTNISELKSEISNIKNDVNSCGKDMIKLKDWYNLNDKLYSPTPNQQADYLADYRIQNELRKYFQN